MPVHEWRVYNDTVSFDNCATEQTCCLNKIRTLGEERRDGEAERNNGQSVEHQEDERYRPVRVVDDCSAFDLEVEKERHESDRNEHEDGILEEPRQPV